MKWNHLGIKTASLEKSLEFYCDILGLRIVDEVDILGKKFYFVGNDDFSIEIEPGNPGDAQANMSVQTGMYHFSLTVDDIKGLVAMLKERELRSLSIRSSPGPTAGHRLSGPGRRVHSTD